MLRVVTDDEGRAEMRSGLDEIVLEGAQRMLAAALEAEVDAYIDGMTGERDENGRRLVVRNGHAEPRTITTAAGRIVGHFGAVTQATPVGTTPCTRSLLS